MSASRSTLGMISDSGSGSGTGLQSASRESESTRLFDYDRSTRQIWRACTGIPQRIRNIVYGYQRAEPRYKQLHLMGQWPLVSRECAATGEAPLSDVIAPAVEHIASLKRDFYLKTIPSLSEAEQREADAECALHKAEISQSAELIRTAAIETALAAELVVEAAVTGSAPSIGGTK